MIVHIQLHFVCEKSLVMPFISIVFSCIILISTALFMARSSNFLKNLPSEFKDDFTDSHSIPKHKINLLKDVLRTKLVSL